MGTAAAGQSERPPWAGSARRQKAEGLRRERGVCWLGVASGNVRSRAARPAHFSLLPILARSLSTASLCGAQSAFAAHSLPLRRTVCRTQSAGRAHCTSTVQPHARCPHALLRPVRGSSALVVIVTGQRLSAQGHSAVAERAPDQLWPPNGSHLCLGSQQRALAFAFSL